MRKALRSFELVYRLGGEEVVVLMPGVELSEGADVAERLRDAIAESQPGGLDLTVSLGVAAAGGSELSAEALLRAADAALYRAKDEGRDRVVVEGFQLVS